MTNLLTQHFPMIRTRAQILSDIQSSSKLASVYKQWPASIQEEFLDFTSGVRGVKLLYDAFFKEIMNPETAPERLNDFLSELLKQPVKILQVLPNDTTRIADESSLVIMDIVVELSNNDIANIEIQKIGYTFPGQRSACYSADMLLRQYKRVRSNVNKGSKFSYRNIKNVYTIILFDKSIRIFHEYKDIYIHNFEQTSDSGLKMELLQKYVFVPLDIFRENLQNKGIRSRLDAWLTLLSVDDPEWIIKVIQSYPEFKAVYAHAYDLCLNIEKVMNMFSKELYELDKNTVLYMIDEMQEDINRKDEALKNKDKELKSKDEALKNKDEALQRIQDEKEQMQQQIAELHRKLHDM